MKARRKGFEKESDEEPLNETHSNKELSEKLEVLFACAFTVDLQVGQRLGAVMYSCVVWTL